MTTARQLFSTITDDHRLVLSVEPVDLPEPGEDEVIVELSAAPINPSDLALILGPADMSTARQEAVDGRPALVADVLPAYRRAVDGRVGKKLPAGNEGAGVVVAAGASAQGLLGKTVSLVGGEMFATHRRIKAHQAIPLPEGASAVEGAALFVNPMTAQGFLNTMRLEGHTAMVHTAAASNLGQMLAKLCVQEDVPLVAIVRKPEQVALLRELGLTHVVNSSSESFFKDLIAAIAATGATLGFDAIGGGDMANTILRAMEAALIHNGEQATIYGTAVHKQVYIYGRLDTGRTELTPGYGMYWGVGGWLLMPHLQRVGRERTAQMRQYTVDERNGVFASQYTRTISLDDMLDPDVARAYDRKATGEKYLVDATR